MLIVTPKPTSFTVFLKTNRESFSITPDEMEDLSTLLDDKTKNTFKIPRLMIYFGRYDLAYIKPAFNSPNVSKIYEVKKLLLEEKISIEEARETYKDLTIEDGSSIIVSSDVEEGEIM